MMGNTESQVAPGNDNQTNHWHGSNPNVAPSMRLLPSGRLPLERKSSSYLEEPVMTKATHRGEAEVTLDQPPSNDREGHEGDASGKLRFAVSEMQGWRSHMEDEHALNPNLASNRQQAMLLKDHHLFAVFDGHGGDFASKFCGEHFVPTLTAQRDWQAYLTQSYTNSAFVGDESRHSVRGITLLKSALTSTFLELDDKLMEAQRKIRLGQLSKLESLVHSLHLGKTFEKAIFQKGTLEHDKIVSFDRNIPPSLPSGVNLERSGTTGVVVLVTPSHIICANAGDSRAILSKKHEVLPLSFDHKPSKDVEVTRVQKDGGFVRAGRVDGDLAVSRGFGDFGYKFCNAKESGHPSTSEQKDNVSVPPIKGQKEYRVTVHPDILVYAREPSNDEFLVLACDGIWDRLTNKDCSDLVRSLVYRDGETDVGLMCEEVIDTALELDSRDNMTCCIVMFPGVTLPIADHLTTISTPKMGVMKRRLDREKTWGKHSTPAMRYQTRCENHRMKYKEVAALQQAKSSKIEHQKGTGKKHKASHPSHPKNCRSRSSKSLKLYQN